jgi:serine/threonine protein kinase
MKLSVKKCVPLGENKRRKFGDVFLLESTDGEKFILKKANYQQVTPRAIQQLKNEENFSFQHAGLPFVCSTDETSDSFSLLLNHKNGINLTEFWKSVPKKQRLAFTQQFVQKAVELLDFIHQQAIYHCDIKPSNFIIEGTLDDFSVHLIDFGLAINQHQLEKRNLIFPLGFAAPELILNKLHLINPTTDFYALGISVYQLWTGSLPLTHPNPSVFTNLQLAHPLPEHDALPKKLMQWLSKVCHKPQWRTAPNLMDDNEVEQFLLQSFEKRFTSSHELVEALQQIEQKRWFW